jgi:hypothetical protein
MPVTAEITAKLKVRQTGSNDFGGPDFSGDMSRVVQLTDGTGENQANIAWMDERTVLTGANDDIDLAGVLTDAFGASVVGAEIVCLFIINKPQSSSAAANTTNLTVGVGTNPVTGYLGGTTPTLGPIRPGNFAMLAGPNVGGFGVVTAGTGDILRVANSAGASATYQIGILMRTA